ncbi:hypothetical protein Tco_0567304 [Tanacetum coccineum]
MLFISPMFQVLRVEMVIVDNEHAPFWWSNELTTPEVNALTGKRDIISIYIFNFHLSQGCLQHLDSDEIFLWIYSENYKSFKAHLDPVDKDLQVLMYLSVVVECQMAKAKVASEPPNGLNDDITNHNECNQTLYVSAWVLLTQWQIQKNPIFQISVDILSNTNFFRAFTASANVPAIYLLTIWYTRNYDDEDWGIDVKLMNNGKTSGSDKPRHPVLQMLWGIVTQSNVDHAELLWEEFTQGIQTFFSHKASHKASLKDPKKKVTPLLIPYGRFSKEIQVLSQKKTPQESASVQPATKHAPPKKPTTTTPVKQSKPAPAPTKKPSKHKLPQKIRKGKPTFQLVDEDDEAQQESIPQEEGDEI